MCVCGILIHLFTLLWVNLSTPENPWTVSGDARMRHQVILSASVLKALSMEDNVFELESSLKQLEIKQEDVCTIWAYGALKVI